MPPSSTSTATTNLEVEAELTTEDLKSEEHAPHAFFLFLNLGLLSAFQGEYYLASRRFRTALSIDDRSSPGNTAVGLHLLGLASFQLGQYLKAVKLWKQCLACFRRFGSMDKGDGREELEMAAPWVTKLHESEKPRQGREEVSNGKEENKNKEPEMWTGFKHKIYNPANVQGTDKKTWEQWDLKRKDVEGNLQAATESAHPQQEEAKSQTADVRGMPGTALFWPIEETVEKPPKKETLNRKSKPISLSLKQKAPVGLEIELSSGAAPGALTRGNEETLRPESSISSQPHALWSRRPDLKLQYQPSLSSPLAASPVLTASEENEDSGDIAAKASDAESPVFAVSPRSAARHFGPDSNAMSSIGAGSPGKSTFMVSYTERGEGARTHQQKQKQIEKNPYSRSNDLRLRNETYTPSSYTSSPPTTQGSSFLGYYGLDASDKGRGEETRKIRQTQQATPYPRERSSDSRTESKPLDEKHQEAWLALNGIEKDKVEHKPVEKASADESTMKHARARGVPSHEDTEPVSPRKPAAKQQEATLQPPSNENLGPSEQLNPPPTAGIASGKSAGSEILSLYNQVSPTSPLNLTPDTARTDLTEEEGTILTPPTPHFNTPTTPEFGAKRSPTHDKSVLVNRPKNFATKPLNAPSTPPPSTAKLTLREKIQHGLETANFGLDGGEGMKLDEAMEIRERIAIEEEYRDYLRRELEKEEKPEPEGGELLPAKSFEGFPKRDEGVKKEEEVVLQPRTFEG